VLFGLAQSVIAERLDHDRLDLVAVATQLGVSSWRLSRAFSACGEDFRSCVRRARMLEAARLLRENGCSIKVVAFDVGYRHQSDFTKHFRAYWVTTPTEFRGRQRQVPSAAIEGILLASNRLGNPGQQGGPYRSNPGGGEV
jgi:AraC-like DNA-binding protein